MIQNVTVTNFARTEAASVLNLTYLTIWSYNGAISTLQPLSTSRSNEDLKLLDGLTPQTRCICDKRMEILNRRGPRSNEGFDTQHIATFTAHATTTNQIPGDWELRRGHSGNKLAAKNIQD